MRILLLILVVIFISGTSDRQKKSINAADYGLKEGEDAVPALRKALNACVELKASKLIIPKGKYDCFPGKASEKYLQVSNNDNGMKRVVFLMNGLSNFEVDGQGAEFVMHGHMVPFDVEHSENIKLRNFSINWVKPFYFQGEVVSIDSKSNSFDLKVLAECNYEIVADELVFLEKPKTATRSWKQWACPIEEEYGWEQNIDWNIWYDSKTKAPAYKHGKCLLRSYNEQLTKRYHAEEIKPGLIRIFDATNNLPEIGWILVVNGRKDKNRLSTAIHLFHNKNVQLENIDIYHAGGMGLIAERTENIRLSNFNVVLPPSSERMVTTTADATHFVNCKGLISIDKCHFENMLDDASNFHGIYTKVEDLVNNHTIGVRRMHGQQIGFQFAEVGDSVRLSNGKTMEPYAILKVTAVSDFNGEYMTLGFDRDVSKILKEGSVADNVSWQADVKLTNSSVRRNRARSILISTQGEVLLENNSFSTCTGVSLLFEGDATFWYESGPVRNVVIRNNTFSDFGLEGGNSPIIQFTPRVTYAGKPTDYYHKNIIFENNRCKAFGHTFVYARSVENFVFRGNTIQKSTDYPMESNQNLPSFIFDKCKSIEIKGNTNEYGNMAGIRVDGFTMDLQSSGNNDIESVEYK